MATARTPSPSSPATRPRWSGASTRRCTSSNASRLIASLPAVSLCPWPWTWTFLEYLRVTAEGWLCFAKTDHTIEVTTLPLSVKTWEPKAVPASSTVDLHPGSGVPTPLLERRTVREASYSGSRRSAGSTPRTPASLRIVEKRGSTSLLSILTSCLRDPGGPGQFLLGQEFAHSQLPNTVPEIVPQEQLLYASYSPPHLYEDGTDNGQPIVTAL